MILQHVSMTCPTCGRTRTPDADRASERVGYRPPQCFSCWRWHERAAYDDPRAVVYAGDYHLILPALGKRAPAERAIIRYLDGRLVVTSDLWCVGTIPAAFRPRLPDNAVRTWPDRVTR